jgi:dephospho-CoA kinase
LIIAGLTGGIASGKSTIAGFFRDAGARIFDADQIAREVVRRGTPAFDDIVSHFGEAIVQPDGEIDRKRLGDIVFNDSRRKIQLEAIVHPAVLARQAEWVDQIAANTPDAVVILDVPLLLEVGMEKDLDAVIVVYVPESVQLIRLMRRDGIDRQAARARIRSQMPIEEKRQRATIVIDNSGTLADSQSRTRVVLNRLRKMSAVLPRTKKTPFSFDT